MGTVMDADTVVKEISDLIELDYDAIEAYKAAIERLDDSTYKSKLLDFQRDHERHVQELSEAVRAEGGTPPAGGDVKQLLTKGKVVVGDLGGDENILKAMKSNEEETNSKYEATAKLDLPENIQGLVSAGLADERRHRAWIDEQLAK